MKAANYPALRRFLVIDRELRNKTYPTYDRLAELTETNPRTLQRDVMFLQNEYKAPIAFNHARNGWEYTEPTYRLPAVLITEGELLGLFIATQSLHLVQGTPYAADLQRAIRKITEMLPEEISIRWESIEGASSFRQSVTTLQDLDTFRRLADAVLHRRQLRLRYFTASRDAESERIIDPWHLANIDGEWYLYAFCHRRQKTLTFVPARIRDLEETGFTFARPENFSIGDFLDGTFRVVQEAGQPLQTVRLRFAPTATKYVREKLYHPSQKNEFHDDGGVTIELQLRSLIEVRRFVMSWGSECTVLEPAELREDIHREAAAILEQTASSPVERIPSRTTRTGTPRQRSG